MTKKWAYSYDNENFYGPFTQKAEAIKQMFSEKGTNQIGYIGIATEYRHEDVAKCADMEMIVEQFLESIDDNYGDYAYEWLKGLDLDGLQKHLEGALLEWIKATGKTPGWFDVYDREKVELTRGETND